MSLVSPLIDRSYPVLYCTVNVSLSMKIRCQEPAVVPVCKTGRSSVSLGGSAVHTCSLDSPGSLAEKSKLNITLVVKIFSLVCTV